MNMFFCRKTRNWQYLRNTSGYQIPTGREILGRRDDQQGETGERFKAFFEVFKYLDETGRLANVN